MKKINAYSHVVQYYETDKMGITHHSNYVRWMEEARVDYLSQLGWDYDKLEEKGIISPVIGIEVKYKGSTSFPDKISIEVSVLACKGVRLQIGYVMKNEEGKPVCEARSEHCFVNKEGRPIRLEKDHPDFYQALAEQIAEG
ncbi:MAG: acyl-CoA thioesterase [Clostridiales bacterium]|nr:acyl-CoA thioesterase [Clostridiales bacterium]